MEWNELDPNFVVAKHWLMNCVNWRVEAELYLEYIESLVGITPKGYSRMDDCIIFYF